MKSCPYCDQSAELYFSSIARKYYRCRFCDLIYLDMQIAYDEAVNAYRENYFNIFSADQLKGKRNKLYDHILTLISKISGNHGPGRLLDVGTGCGFFLVNARQQRWEVRGIEPSLQSVGVAREQNGLDVFCGTLEEYDDKGQFDVITLINVLDHSSMPWKEIGRASKLLRPGGLIYLRFPNGFLHSRIYRTAIKCGVANSIRKFLVFHAYCFTHTYIRKLLNDHGLIQTTIFNSPHSEGDSYGLFSDPALGTYVKRIVYAMAKFIEAASCKQLFIGTSLEVTATKPI